jgi:hypothetical protein
MYSIGSYLLLDEVAAGPVADRDVLPQPLVQAQFSPQLHFGVQQAQEVSATAFWQPQVQLEPGQVLQLQLFALVVFMSISVQLGGYLVMRGQCRGLPPIPT